MGLHARVTVLVASPHMLARVQRHPAVSVRLTAAESMPFPDGHFDACTLSDAFHHFRDQDAAAAEMARVVRPGGGVLIFEFRRKLTGRVLVPLERGARRARLVLGARRTPPAVRAARHQGRHRPAGGLHLHFAAHRD